jgi:hypothetical protein
MDDFVQIHQLLGVQVYVARKNVFIQQLPRQPDSNDRAVPGRSNGGWGVPAGMRHEMHEKLGLHVLNHEE